VTESAGKKQNSGFWAKLGLRRRSTTNPPSSDGQVQEAQAQLQGPSPEAGAAARGAGSRRPRPEKYDPLWQLAMTDPQTGLANKMVVLDRMSQALILRQRHGGVVVLFRITLDNLGEINLDYGNAAGTTVICEVAQRLTTLLRTEDTVGRIGGVELVVVVTVSDEQAVGPLTKRLRHALDQPVIDHGHTIKLHALMKSAVVEDPESPQELMRLLGPD
jgi:diguanylate cyclase (GGDEF)-like protein